MLSSLFYYKNRREKKKEKRKIKLSEIVLLLKFIL